MRLARRRRGTSWAGLGGAGLLALALAGSLVVAPAAASRASARPHLRLVGKVRAVLSDDKLAVIVTTRIQVDQRVTLTITGRGPGGRALLFGNPATGPTATLHRVAPAGPSQLRVLVPVMRNHLVAGKAYDVSVVATGSGGQRSAPLVFAFRAP